MIHGRAERKAQTAALDEGFTFASLLDRPGFRRHPAQSVVSLIAYGLERHRAGIAGVWPSHVPAALTGGETDAPPLFAAAFRVDGLGIALLALGHAERSGISVPDALRQQVETEIGRYAHRGELAADDLALTGGLTAHWGHEAVAAAVRRRIGQTG